MRQFGCSYSLTMFLIDFTRVFLLSSVMIDVNTMFLEPRIQKQRLNQNPVCYNVTTKPYYQKQVVTGKPWHAYVIWNMPYEQCMKINFKSAGNLNEMVKYLKSKFYALNEEPNWAMAELLMHMGPSKEMILFRDRSGIHGQFDGVPYYKRDEFPYEPPLRKVFKMTIKVFQRGKYAILSDCTSGVTLFLAHPENRPKRVEIEAFASQFNFGTPYSGCIGEPDPVIKNVTDDFIESTTAMTTKKPSKYDW